MLAFRYKLINIVSMKESDIILSLYPENSAPLDDCFLWEKKNTLISTDTICEGTHFRLDWSSPEDIAVKLLEVNVSDLISSGGQPETAFLNLGISQRQDSDWLKRFSSELKYRLKKRGVILAGGDTYFSPVLNLTMTVLGERIFHSPRTGANAGENLYLTGPLGYSNAGYIHLSEKRKLPEGVLEKAIQKHLRPESRMDIFSLLRNINISAMMDMTDGLIQDSEKFAAASGKSLLIYADRIPEFGFLSKCLNTDEILSSGEELELLFSSRETLTDFACIGKVTDVNSAGEKPEVRFVLNGQEFIPEKKGFFHFQGESIGQN
ncbi:MAG TPA: thiamine-phosphate kinase [Leptospiraceae bacterium]|nr:thiamine-phosphate kinase [Leptospiraceae bacterium]